jgi:glycine/D-amino acid oxidase-like deaminating enzyme
MNSQGISERASALPGGEADVAVIGGGVVGLSIAYGLSRLGRRVIVLDEGDVAHRASRGNFALVWVQGKGLSMPEYALWSLRSADLWGGFAQELEERTGEKLSYSRKGGLMAALSEEELDARTLELSRLHNQAPDTARFERLDHAGMKRLLPEIGPSVAGGTYCPADGHVNSLRLFSALHQAAINAGADYRPNAAVEKLDAHGGGFRMTTARGEVRAGQVVLAAGLGNARLAPMVGLDAPVRPQRGQVMVTEKLAPFLHYPLGTIRQTDEGGVMIGDSKEEVGLDNSSHHAVLAGIAARAIRLFPLLEHARVVRSWGALRVMSPDGMPIYDQSITHPGAFLVTCHSGITLAAAHADVLAADIAESRLAAELAVFSARRFNGVSKGA